MFGVASFGVQNLIRFASRILEQKAFISCGSPGISLRILNKRQGGGGRRGRHQTCSARAELTWRILRKVCGSRECIPIQVCRKKKPPCPSPQAFLRVRINEQNESLHCIVLKRRKTAGGIEQEPPSTAIAQVPCGNQGTRTCDSHTIKSLYLNQLLPSASRSTRGLSRLPPRGCLPRSSTSSQAFGDQESHCPEEFLLTFGATAQSRAPSCVLCSCQGEGQEGKMSSAAWKSFCK